MQRLRDLIARSPQASLLLGKAVFLAGGVLVLGALFGRFQLMNLNAERTEGKLPPLATLAEAYPQFPTWLVPEGPVGFVLAAILVLIGTVLVSLASDVLKRRRRLTPW